MPLFFQQQLNSHTQLAIWKIEEAESFFEVPLQRSITHPHKQLQHLAGRYLLRFLFPRFPLALIRVDDTRKPFLQNELFHFSISHCGDFAAAIVSTQNRVGVDIELVTEKIGRIEHKFVSEEERLKIEGLRFEVELKNQQPATPNSEFTTLNAQLTLIWSCKEAVFKWYGSGNVDFKKHMQLQSMETSDAKLFQMAMLFKKGEYRLLHLQSRLFDDLCLSYVIT